MKLVARRVLNAGRDRDALALTIYDTGKLLIQQDADVIEIDEEYIEFLSNTIQTLFKILRPTPPTVWRSK